MSRELLLWTFSCHIGLGALPVYWAGLLRLGFWVVWVIWTLRMADREDNVYQAKLAEQAERYDGVLKLGKYP